MREQIFRGVFISPKQNLRILNFDNAVFRKDIVFNSIKNSDKIKCENVIFYDKFIMNEVDFKEANFQKVSFHSDTSFVNSNFQEALFEDMVTEKLISFSEVSFLKIVSFLRAIFHHYAIFDGSNFNGNANFSLVKFKDIAKFEESTFQQANFEKAQFYFIVSFKKAKFDEANFTQAVFKDRPVFSEATFQKAYFRQAQFNEPSFNQAHFRETTDFTDAKLIASFTETEFNNVDFDYAEFDKGASFAGRTFENVKFTNSNFEGLIDFSKANFKNAFYSNVRSKDIIVFSGSVFGDIKFDYCEIRVVKFTESKFETNFTFYNSKCDLAEFNYTQFESADFSYSTFQNAYFVESRFRIASFLRSRFEKEALFSSATFIEEADFRYSMIQTAPFNNVDFQGKASFNMAEFRTSYFNDAFFSGEEKITFVSTNFGIASFIHCKFLSDTDIINSSFQSVIFDYSVFCGTAHFTYCNFGDYASYVETEFQQKADFKLAKFQTAYFIKTKFKQLAGFTFAIFRKAEEVIFEIEDMSNISFANTDISRIRFSENAAWGKDGRFKLAYEDEALSNPKRAVLGNIKALYRNLRENYEYRLRYDEAGEFFIREMELKRKYRETDTGVKKNDWFARNFSLTGIYRLASYGEKFRMPIILSIMVLSASILFWLADFHTINRLSLTYGGLTYVGNATERSITSFLQLRNEHLLWQDYIIKALGILSLGLFAIPLRRKFERKFRH